MAKGDPPATATTYDVIRSFTMSTTLFFGFIVFANWIHNLKCGTLCHFFFGSA